MRRGGGRESAVTGRRGITPRPDADQSAASQAEPVQEVLTSEDGSRRTRGTPPGRPHKVSQPSLAGESRQNDAHHN